MSRPDTAVYPLGPGSAFDALAESSWPPGRLDGDAKLIIAGQKEEANRQRGDFPEYQRVSRCSEESLRSTRHKCASDPKDDFPAYAAALKERQRSEICPPYATLTGRS
mmetsp:Transcript_111982/g.311792  ORF Transcript_111982/g.311792 Transcript_111982/m.311792 type:complete len:108 (+) Transcript_111982:51-374(+)|eukprot:CAMPEP_0179141426 /NCGR_PEP_ID=MMETSP0796-20121207/67828_1 /TAXON_ID=73915 /ORGANISM="Pyrodinium bahamense, Strain pbaha01" /LENGTH=107 /DNA_ID=CAMNT_0020841145 /DNA_START=50 /DNA_END=376 /DNA_ORIENTATION=-